MRDILTLPAGAPLPEHSPGIEEVLDAWAAYLGRDRRDMPLLLVRDTRAARRLLLRAAGIAPGERVGVPAHTRRALSEAVKKAGGKPLFVELDRDLGFDSETPGLDGVRIMWAEPAAGLAPPAPLPGTTLLVDYGFALPTPLAPDGALPGAATLWGLHLARERAAAEGALVAFHDRDLYDRARSLLLGEDELADPRPALAQCHRLGGPDGLAARLLRVYAEARAGMEAGAGLPMAPACSPALPFGLAVRIPDEADVGTFISYARNENVALDWLPELQPIFYVAYQVTRDPELTRRSAAHLARWIVSPLGPDFNDDEIVHAVLGILKAAEYTGVRWYTDPARARWYGDLMFEWYGPEHDAFRLAFAAPEVAAVAAD